MKQLSLSTGEFLLVKIPEVLIASDCEIHKGYLYMGALSIRHTLPPGQWSIIGKPLELDEWACISIVEKINGLLWIEYKNYEREKKPLTTEHYFNPKQSLLSLVESNSMKPE